MDTIWGGDFVVETLRVLGSFMPSSSKRHACPGLVFLALQHATVSSRALESTVTLRD